MADSVRTSWRLDDLIIRDPVILAEDLRRINYPDDNVSRRCNKYAMMRGRRPGNGAVLMSYEDYQEINEPQQCIHTLKIEAQNKIEIKKLCVTGIQAIAANVEADVSLKPDTPVIVELADARHYAGMSSIDRAFNYRDVTGVSRRTRSTLLQVLEDITFPLVPIFDSDFEFLVDEAEWAPDNLRLFGIPAWDALWIVLDLAGLSLAVMPNGTPRIFTPKNVNESQALMDRINAGGIGKRSRYDTFGEVIDPALPQVVRAYTQQADYQFYNDPTEESRSSGDMVSRYPVYQKRFSTLDLLRDEDLDGKDIAEGTEDIVWGTVPNLIGDREERANPEEVDADLEAVATKYLQARARLHRGWTWIYSGVAHPFFPNSHFTAVGYADIGGVFRCQVKIGDDLPVEWDGAELVFNAELSRNQSPSYRDPVPYGRELYGVVLNKFPKSERENEPILDGEAALVDLQSGHRMLDDEGQLVGVTWERRFDVVALNGSGGVLLPDMRVFGRWNYQIGVSGEWVIVAARGGEYTNECLVAPTQFDRLKDPTRIVLDKRSMIKLVLPDGENPEDPRRIGISFFSGPPNSVLRTPGAESAQPIVWDTCPTLEAINVNCQIKIGGQQVVPTDVSEQAQAQIARNEPDVTWIDQSRHGAIKVRLPEPPMRSDQFLVSGPTQGQKTELEWAGPGLTGELTVQDVYAQEQILRFENGILVYSSDNEAFALPDKKYGVEFDDCGCEQFNPCDEPVTQPIEEGEFCVHCLDPTKPVSPAQITMAGVGTGQFAAPGLAGIINTVHTAERLIDPTVLSCSQPVSNELTSEPGFFPELGPAIDRYVTNLVVVEQGVLLSFDVYFAENKAGPFRGRRDVFLVPVQGGVDCIGGSYTFDASNRTGAFTLLANGDSGPPLANPDTDVDYRRVRGTVRFLGS